MNQCVTRIISLSFRMKTFNVGLTSCPRQVQMTHDKMNNSGSHDSDTADDIMPDLLVLLFVMWTKLQCITTSHPLLKLPPL